MQEILKDAVGHEGVCQVSNLGRVRTLPYKYPWRGSFKINKGKILKPYKVRHNYLQVDIRHRSFYVHRLVAETFIPNQNNLPCVNHKDENPLNNSVNNLEWCNHQYNVTYSLEKTRRRLMEAHGKPIYRIDMKTGERYDYPNIKSTSKDGFCEKTVSAACAQSYQAKIRNKYKNNLWYYAENIQDIRIEYEGQQEQIGR